MHEENLNEFINKSNLCDRSRFDLRKITFPGRGSNRSLTNRSHNCLHVKFNES